MYVKSLISSCTDCFSSWRVLTDSWIADSPSILGVYAASDADGGRGGAGQQVLLRACAVQAGQQDHVSSFTEDATWDGSSSYSREERRCQNLNSLKFETR